MFLTEKEFMQQIGTNKKYSNDLIEFTKQVTIMYKNPITIYDFIRNMDKTDKRNENMLQWIQFFHDVLVTYRKEVLTKFYNSYLFTDEIEYLFEEDLFKESLEELEKTLINEEEKVMYIQRKDKTKRIIRNLYAKEILNDTTITNSIQGKPNFWKSLQNFFNGKIDDRLFAPSSIHLYIRDKTLQTPIYLLQQYQSKASIINPAILFTLLNKKLNNSSKDKKLFTPEMSWSTYLLTYLNSGEDWNEYIGVDVMDSVINKSNYLYHLYKSKNPKTNKKVKLIQKPSESLLNNEYFLKTYYNSIDCVFYCPPYYDMEIYPDSSGLQSIDMYKDYDTWLHKYLFATLDLCIKVLKKNGKFAIVIGNYHKKLNGEFYNLISDFRGYMNDIKNMKLINNYFLKNRTSPLKNNNKLRGELLFIYQKL